MTHDDLLDLLADLRDPSTLIAVHGPPGRFPVGVTLQWRWTPKEWCEANGVDVGVLVEVAESTMQACGLDSDRYGSILSSLFMLGWESCRRFCDGMQT